MSIDYLTFKIQYDIKKAEFTVSGDVNETGQETLLNNFLRDQMGAGKDEREANIQDVYTITFKWYPADDTINVAYDTGNKGLRDGILMKFFQQLKK